MRRLLVLLLILCVPALAGAETFTGALTTSDPIYPNGRPDDSDCGDQIDDLLPDKYRYRLIPVTVTASGTYTYLDLRSTEGTIDIEVAVFDGPFDAANPTVNCLSSMDDGNTISLQSGTPYLLAVTSWDQPTTGPYAFSIVGPGAVLGGGATGGATAVSTWSAWTPLAMIALIPLVAATGRRRRRTG